MPAYEEAANLKILLPTIHLAAKQITSSYEIVVVDAEQPTDDTKTICAKHGATYIRRTGGPKFGDAMRTAQHKARGRFIVCMDADGSHNPEFLPTLCHGRENFDLTIASRYVPGGKTENPAVLIFLSLIVNIGFRLVLGLKCHDVSNSFRLYRGDDFRKLNLECDHFDIIEEILVKLCVLHPGYRLREIPFTFEKRKAGKTKRQLWLFALGYLGTLIHLLKLKYKAQRQRVA